MKDDERQDLQLADDQAVAERRKLQELLDWVAERSELSDEEASKLAAEELHAMRAGQ